jgi:hypothetical protein
MTILGKLAHIAKTRGFMRLAAELSDAETAYKAYLERKKKEDEEVSLKMKIWEEKLRGDSEIQKEVDEQKLSKLFYIYTQPLSGGDWTRLKVIPVGEFDKVRLGEEIGPNKLVKVTTQGFYDKPGMRFLYISRRMTANNQVVLAAISPSQYQKIVALNKK